MGDIDHYVYWEGPPPKPSPKLLRWVAKIEAGWRPNRRVRQMGRDACQIFYDVYQWEWLHVIAPLLDPIGGRTLYVWTEQGWRPAQDLDDVLLVKVDPVTEEMMRQETSP